MGPRRAPSRAQAAKIVVSSNPLPHSDKQSRTGVQPGYGNVVGLGLAGQQLLAGPGSPGCRSLLGIFAALKFCRHRLSDIRSEPKPTRPWNSWMGHAGAAPATNRYREPRNHKVPPTCVSRPGCPAVHICRPKNSWVEKLQAMSRHGPSGAKRAPGRRSAELYFGA